MRESAFPPLEFGAVAEGGCVLPPSENAVGDDWSPSADAGGGALREPARPPAGEDFSLAGIGKPRAEGETASAAEEATEPTALDNSVLMLCGRDAWLSLVPGPVYARSCQRVDKWIRAQLGHGLVKVILWLSRGHLKCRIG